jgi:ribosomal protein L7/L12
MSNYYAQAIQVLADSKTDFQALAYEVAKANPKAVAKAAERLGTRFGGQKECASLSWQKECASLMASSLKFQAIKRCRELSGMGLQEAKDAVEALV